jgi:hypothetical protein
LRAEFEEQKKNAQATPVRKEEKMIENIEGKSDYPVHKNILTTVFWVGEKAKFDNGFISNDASAWDKEWVINFGGEDTPNDRNGYFPKGFKPNENPFYFALPYNDMNGSTKKKSVSDIPWARDSDDNKKTILKNRWIKIMFGGKTCYGQWQDVGPFNTNDFQYVFNGAKPQHRVGLDVSPAIHDCLEMTGQDYVNWQFIEAENVPSGPWKEIVTK